VLSIPLFTLNLFPGFPVVSIRNDRMRVSRFMLWAILQFGCCTSVNGDMYGLERS